MVGCEHPVGHASRGVFEVLVDDRGAFVVRTNTGGAIHPDCVLDCELVIAFGEAEEPAVFCERKVKRHCLAASWNRLHQPVEPTLLTQIIFAPPKVCGGLNSEEVVLVDRKHVYSRDILLDGKGSFVNFNLGKMLAVFVQCLRRHYECFI